MLSLGLIAAGFFLGMIFVPLLLRWALLVHTSFGLHGGDFLGAPKRRLIWVAPFIILLHPFPCIVAGTAVLTILAVHGRVSSGWLWFLGGFYAYVLLMGGVVIPKLLVIRRKMHNVRND